MLRITIEKLKMPEIFPFINCLLVVFGKHFHTAFDEEVKFPVQFATSSFPDIVETEWTYLYFVNDVKLRPIDRINYSGNIVRSIFLIRFLSETDVSDLL